ncbi:Cullin [Mycena floridula]|nr:Cullin [Mycena floridula]
MALRLVQTTNIHLLQVTESPSHWKGFEQRLGNKLDWPGSPDRDGNRTGTNLVGSDLYPKLSGYFVSHFKSMKKKAATLQDEDPLRYYAAEWDRYTTGAHYLNRLFTYLNRYWVKRERGEGQKRFIRLHAQWKTHSFVPIQKETQARWCCLSSHRAPAQWRHYRSRHGCHLPHSLISLGLDNADPDKECLDVYNEHFERVERYLHTKTRKKLITKCEPILGKASRFRPGRRLTMNRFALHAKQAGLSPVLKLVGHGGDTGADNLDPKVYVDALLEVHRQTSETVFRSFKSEAGFAKSLDKACRELDNRNTATGTSSTKSLELITKHADLLLRKNNKRRERIKPWISGDKDVFQTIYTTKLPKRLIHGLSVSDESEASMISKLKEACGFEYTNKLQPMFTGSSFAFLIYSLSDAL